MSGLIARGMPCSHMLVACLLLLAAVLGNAGATGSGWTATQERRFSTRTEGRSLAATPTATNPVDGYWSTDGSKIVDSAGNQVLFSGICWMGLDSTTAAPHGLWSRSMGSMLDQMQELGFNLIRLGFAGSTILTGNPSSIDYGLNPELKNMSTLQVMDAVIVGCAARGMKVILDFHRVMPGSAPEAGLWYTADHPETEWISIWQTLAQRYNNYPTVIGADLFNEPHKGGDHPGPVWAADSELPGFNWKVSTQKAAEAIHAINPNLLIFVEGLGEGWWGGNVSNALTYPIELTTPNKLVYSVHDYGPTIHQQPWFDDPTFPANMPAFWDSMFGGVLEGDVAPVWLGEFGSMFDTAGPLWAKEKPYLIALHDYIKLKRLPWTYFMWTPNSGDTGGILDEDYKAVRTDKMSYLQDLMYPSFGQA